MLDGLYSYCSNIVNNVHQNSTVRQYCEETGFCVENLEQERGWSDYRVIHSAAESGKLDVVNALIPRVNIEAKTKYQFTPLHLAACNGHLESVRSLTAHGANCENISIHKTTPLISAAYRGHLNTVKFLVEHRVNIEAKADMAKFDSTENDKSLIKDATAIVWAAQAGKLDVVQYLVEQGSDYQYVYENYPNCQKTIIKGCKALRDKLKLFILIALKDAESPISQLPFELKEMILSLASTNLVESNLLLNTAQKLRLIKLQPTTDQTLNLEKELNVNGSTPIMPLYDNNQEKENVEDDNQVSQNNSYSLFSPDEYKAWYTQPKL